MASANKSRPDMNLDEPSIVHSSKRRKLSPAIIQTPEASHLPATSASVRTTRSSARKDSGIFTIAEDDDTEAHEMPISQSSDRVASAANVLLKVTDGHDPEKENDIDGQNEAELRSAANSARSSLKLNNTKDLALEPILPLPGDQHLDVEHDALHEGQSGIGSEEDVEVESVKELSDSGPGPAPTQRARQPKRKKRSSAGIGRKRKRLSVQSTFSNEADTSISQDTELRAPSPNLATLVMPPQEDEDSELDQDHEPSRSRHPGRRRELPIQEDEEDGDETYIQEASPEPPTPAPTKRTSTKRIQQRKPIQPEGQGRSKPAIPTFPILTHRMTNVSALSTIHEEPDLDSQAMESGRATNMSHERSQPNVVDVLAQICRETIANLMESISRNVQPSERTSTKTKRAALEAFGEDLNEELFQMSEAVENRIELEARVRKSKREKVGLQLEYIEIRKQRERIALKCDSVRRRHWECEQDVREKWNISEAARRVELDMDRNEEEVDEGVEYLLRSVTNNVSNLSDAGGILDKAKAFNAQLATMALMLERRHG